ncbi:MAG: class I SAM-dependent methyltransferase [Anaerolineae bacterium]|jgi:SAM-dependent methyltransferase
MSREQADRALFNRIAFQYAKKDVIPSSSLARRTQLLLAMAPLFEVKPTLGTIVEIGCGVGAPARYLDGHYEQYIGIDQSEGMVDAARVFHQENPRVSFMAENVKSGRLPQDVADVVLAVGALHHMTPLNDVMVSLNRIARPGAFMVAIEPQNGNPLIQVMRWVRGKIDPSYSQEQVFFSTEELEEIFTRHGITGLEVSFQGYLTPPFAQVIIPPQFLTVPLVRLAIRVERWLQAHLPQTLRGLSFNVVVIGRFRD